MHKIRTKLLVAFSALILILLVEMVFNQVVIQRAADTYEVLTSEMVPAVRMLEKFHSVSNEPLLLASSKLVKNELWTTNRMKEIAEVELPYFKTEMSLLQKGFATEGEKQKLSQGIIDEIASIVAILKQVNQLLLTDLDYQNEEKVALASQRVENDLSQLSFSVQNQIVMLKMAYNTQQESVQVGLSKQLKTISTIILWMSIIGIVFALVVTYQVVRSIAQPIKSLDVFARQIKDGEFHTNIEIKGKSELASLANSFNEMAHSLKDSFDKIKSKNKELEQFVYIASHDLQEPLRTLTSITLLLEEEYKKKDDPIFTKYIHYISTSSQRMSDLVKSLLDYGRIGRKLVLTDLDCTTLINGVMADLGGIIAQKKAVISMESMPTVKGYEMELRLLFQNLISNALKFQPEGGQPTVHISTTRKENFQLFSVQDNGIGIEEEHQEKIFAIFQRLQNRKQYDGTGIGLAHCKKIVEMHQGKIWVESKPNEGSTFFFTISNQLT